MTRGTFRGLFSSILLPFPLLFLSLLYSLAIGISHSALHCTMTRSPHPPKMETKEDERARPKEMGTTTLRTQSGQPL